MEIIQKIEKKPNLKCEMCGVQEYGLIDTYLWIPPAQSISHTPNMTVCAKCARRELGHKNIKKWRELNE